MGNSVKVKNFTQRIVVDSATCSVRVVNAGPPGPPGVNGVSITGPTGATGAQGPGGNLYDTQIHHQIVPAASWPITHAWPGGYPSVTIIDSAGNIIVGEVTYLTSTTLVVNFSSPFAGKAFLN